MLELKFTYEAKDYSNYSKDSLGIKRILKYILKINTIPLTIVSLIVSLFFTMGLFGGLYLGYWQFYATMITVFAIMLVLSCGFIFIPTFLFGGKIIQRQRKGIAEDIKLIINDDTILFDNGDIQSTYKWNSIKDCYNKKYNLLIFIGDVQALIIPKRIFNSNEEVDNCWNYIQNCYNNAQKV